MKNFKKTLIYPIFDVESIGDVPRVPRTHLDVVFAQNIHVNYASPVSYSCIPVLAPVPGMLVSSTAPYW